MKANSWNLTPIFKSDTDPQIKKHGQAVEKQSYIFINKWKDRRDYLSSPAVLKQALDEYEAWQANFGTNDAEIYYFSLRSSQDQLDPKLKARLNQALEKGRKIQNDIQFFYLRLAKIPISDQAKFIAYPGLKDYRHFLEMLFAEAQYQLTEPEEKIMTLKQQTSHSNWVRMVDSFLSKEERVITDGGKKTTKVFADLFALLYRQDKKVRDQAAAAINEILEKYSDTAENELNSILANKKINDELRHFPRPDSARHLSDDIDTAVVDTLIAAVAKEFSISAHWYRLKAKLLGLPKLKYHDRMIEYGQLTKPYSFAETKSILSKTFHALDPEFGQIFDRFVKNGQIDVYPKKGKSDGAYCASGSLTLPTYILTNHTNILSDVRTLAHETGHGINDELMKKSQNALNFGSPLSTAEVASTFMEDFVWEEITHQADDDTRLAIMAKRLDDDVGTIFRQAACYLFEKELHLTFRQRGYLSKAEIGEMFQKHMAAYIGPAVEASPGSQNWWVYWSHIRRFFYVYSYASGLLISKSLQAQVKKDQAAIAKVKQFLSAGSSQSPREIFLSLGIDITDSHFWLQGLSETRKLLTETETLAKKLGKT